MAYIDVLSPVTEANALPKVSLAPRGELPDRIHLALIDNGKPKASEILELMAEALTEWLPIDEVEVFSKHTAAFPIAWSDAQDIAERADLAIAAIGDCGACSACSLHDAIQLESLGVPATVIITDVFPRTVASFARALGADGYAPVVLPHPVSSRGVERLRSLVREAAPTAHELLVGSVAAPAPLTL
jgi:hypothetical protein